MAIELPDLEAVTAIFHNNQVEAALDRGEESSLADDGEELMCEYADLSEKAKTDVRDAVGRVYDAILEADANAEADDEEGEEGDDADESTEEGEAEETTA